MPLRKRIAWTVLAAVICAMPLAALTMRAPGFAAPMAWMIGANVRRAIMMSPAAMVAGLIALAMMRQRPDAVKWAIAAVAIVSLGYAGAYSAGVVHV
jgi:hypothetical protein